MATVHPYNTLCARLSSRWLHSTLSHSVSLRSVQPDHLNAEGPSLNQPRRSLLQQFANHACTKRVSISGSLVEHSSYSPLWFITSAKVSPSDHRSDRRGRNTYSLYETKRSSCMIIWASLTSAGVVMFVRSSPSCPGFLR